MNLKNVFLISNFPPENAKICTSEFDENRPIFLREHIEKYRADHQKIKVLMGSDLLKRMQKCQTFLQHDLEVMQSQAEFWIVSRSHESIMHQMNELSLKRNIKLSWQELNVSEFLNEGSDLFQLSSTVIRQLAVEGVNLEMCLPASIAQSVSQQAHVWQESILQQLHQNYYSLQKRIDDHIQAIQQTLSNFKKGDTLAIVETSTGGKLADAFCKPYGMSAYFLEGKVLYSKKSQRQFLMAEKLNSIISEQHVLTLAKRLKKQTGASYVIAESGMAGAPDGTRHSVKNGQMALALISENMEQTMLIQNPVFLTKEEHRLRFVLHAAEQFLNLLQS